MAFEMSINAYINNLMILIFLMFSIDANATLQIEDHDLLLK